ncbi:MAG TPA: HD domain-containing protein [Bacteroidia bacterium]|jgi:HD superfamily phosphohydrolase|nr:HD domain-containing protein [Bacteroidia bacterium]
MNHRSKKSKIINDPIYGFVTLPGDFISDLINHPYFQRLRRIKQLGMTNLVYPGALHTRFHHAIGAMHLMTEAIDVLRSKEIEITDEEAEAVTVAILLHDIGHGPFSHALEHSIAKNISHEDFSSLLMEKLNKEFNGKLTLAIKIFNDQYKKKFLHQLVSSQLDMDRLDYLKRDSFFTGVSEGVISSDRIIKMLHVKNDELAIEEKGIYSIEKFIIARRLMYWQVYLHKTVVAAENMLVNILKRAKELSSQGEELFATPSFTVFLKNNYHKKDFIAYPGLLETFALLDDYDIFTSVKVWMHHPDKILSTLCMNLVNRKLFKIELTKEKIDPAYKKQLLARTAKLFKVTEKEALYYVASGEIENSAYKTNIVKINILMNTGKVLDIAEASDQLNTAVLSKTVKKYFICYPKNLNA